jgi:hypothetical protein
VYDGLPDDTYPVLRMLSRTGELQLRGYAVGRSGPRRNFIDVECHANIPLNVGTYTIKITIELPRTWHMRPNTYIAKFPLYVVP